MLTALALVVAPFALVGGALAQYLSPIRYSLFVIIFLGLALDPADAVSSSLAALIAQVLFVNLNKTIPIQALALPGMTLVLLFLLLLVALRRSMGDKVDRAGLAAQPLFLALACSFIAVMVLVVLGVARGGDIQMAKNQVQSFVQMLLMGYLAAVGLRDGRDYRVLGRLVVIAAGLRSVYVLLMARILEASLAPGEELHAAATHGDSMLFATATILLLVRFLERPNARTALWCGMLLPLFSAAMVANNRRLVWVEVGAGMLIYVLVSRRSRLKRMFARAAIASLPLVIAYIAVGWNSGSGVFAPVRTIRSMTDAKVDSSTQYRDTENYNLLLTLRKNPFVGTGFGQPFDEVIVLPNISFFEEYRYMPHNSILGLWAYTGILGFSGIMVVIVVGVYLAGRSYRLARTSDERTAAFMTIAIVAVYAVHAWGDIGFSERRTILLVGPALAIAGQLACATGAWTARSAKQVLPQAA